MKKLELTEYEKMRVKWTGKKYFFKSVKWTGKKYKKVQELNEQAPVWKSVRVKWTGKNI